MRKLFMELSSKYILICFYFKAYMNDKNIVQETTARNALRIAKAECINQATCQHGCILAYNSEKVINRSTFT